MDKIKFTQFEFVSSFFDAVIDLIHHSHKVIEPAFKYK